MVYDAFRFVFRKFKEKLKSTSSRMVSDVLIFKVNAVDTVKIPNVATIANIPNVVLLYIIILLSYLHSQALLPNSL